MGTFKKSPFADLKQETVTTPTKLYANVESDIIAECVKTAIAAGCNISFGSARGGNAFLIIYHDDDKDQFYFQDSKALARKLKEITKIAETLIQEEIPEIE